MLFISALKPATVVELAKVSLPQEKQEEQIIVEKPSLDQVDNLLSKFVAQEVVPPTPASPKVEAFTPPEHTREWVVKQGDSLEKMAKSTKTTVHELMRTNRLTDSKLQIGQVIYVPKGEEMMPQLPVKYYVVKHGDNPWTIAIKNGLKVEELLKLNHLDESKAKKLKPGDKLRIQWEQGLGCLQQD